MTQLKLHVHAQAPLTEQGFAVSSVSKTPSMLQSISVPGNLSTHSVAVAVHASALHGSALHNPCSA